MPPKNIAAYTAPHGPLYPEYISIKKHERGISIVTRAPEKAGTDGHIRCGEVTEIIISLDHFATMILEAGKYLAEYMPPDPNQQKLDV